MLFFGEGEFFSEVEIFLGGVQIFFEGWRCFRKCLRFFREGLGLFPWCWVCSGVLKDFWGGGGEIFSGWLISIFMCIARLKLSKGGYIFRNWDFLMGLIGRVRYFKGVENFPMVFERLRIFQVGGLRLFHNVWDNFRVVETFTRGNVFSFSCRLRFSFFDGGRREADIFPEALRFLMGLRYSQWLEFLVRMFEIFQVVAGGLTFFLEVIQFFFVFFFFWGGGVEDTS